MKNTHELEDDLRERWLKSYPDDERKAFCFDGLCYNGEIYNDGKNAHQGNEEKLWNNTDRRILFLMKDTNNNSDSDYREWPVSYTHLKITGRTELFRLHDVSIFSGNKDKSILIILQ